MFGQTDWPTQEVRRMTTNNPYGITWRRNVVAKTVTFRGGNLQSPVTVHEQYMLGRNYDTRKDQHNPPNDLVIRMESFINRHYDPSSPTGGLDAKTIRRQRQRVWDKVNNAKAGDVIWFDGKKLQIRDYHDAERNPDDAIIAIKGGMLLVHWNHDQNRWLTDDGCRYNACHKHRVIQHVMLLGHAMAEYIGSLDNLSDIY